DSNPIYDTDTPDIIGYDSDSNPIYDTASTDDSPDSERPAIDYCLSLDGDGDFVRVFSSGDVAVVENWTTEAWVKFYRNTNWDSQPVLRLGEGATTSVGSYFLYARYYESLYGNLPMGGYGYSGSSFNTLFGNEALVDGEWTHLAFVYTSDKQQFFVNGELQVEQYFQNSAYELRTDNLIIGAIEHPQLTGYFDGCIDNVRISNTIRYTDDFTPPTELYPDDYTLALWTFTGEETGIFLDATGRLEAEFVGDAEIIEK
ncbi:MAG: LamG domain-containing protein, partial [Deltaproteobacteria bacterium]|nr:LamG domain-containing protein [Deltaproteobacteria bacterium]